MLDRPDDTIVAISSAPGCGARGIVRLSGPAAHALADQIFIRDDKKHLTEAVGHERLLGRVRIDERATIPAEAYSFRAPASYTRQDIVEIHTIGSPAVLAMVLEALTSRGARTAGPGEFTARAFFSGAMDLTRVEGVAAMINARNDSQLRASEALLHGKLSRQSSAFRNRLADLLALIEADIDFAEEPIEFVTLPVILETLDDVIASLNRLIADAPSTERLEILPQVLLTGRPNSGKSTLFNSLTGMDRAIRSATAGTTRDIIPGPLRVQNGEVLLLDSAGVTPGHERIANEPLPEPDQIAQRIALRQLASAELIIVVADIQKSFEQPHKHLTDALANKPVLIAANKTDTISEMAITKWMTELDARYTAIPISAKTGEGIEQLKNAIGKAIFDAPASDEMPTLALSNRQRAALNEALASLKQARNWCEHTDYNQSHTELLALHLREAINAFSLLEGRVTTDDLLDRIFSRFCIGK